jgi:uncharacterized protein (TIGR02391 family)
MNLKTHIRTELWLAISNTYEAENYSHAILDAMHHLSNVLREKSGVDGDGVSLVGQALGGSPPRLRVNKLQTETERNVQKGLEQILRGLYQAIRNPRSHEQIEDTKDTADAIIYFINYLMGILHESEEPFTVPKFLSRVLDPDFVELDQYAELLAAEIPVNKRTDTLIEMYRMKRAGDGQKLKYMVRAIIQQLSDDQVTDFLAVVSDELQITQYSADIRVTLQILPPDLWPRIDEAARLRVENKLIKSIEEGELALDSGEPYEGRGAFGTWAMDFLEHFKLKSRVRRVLLDKLEDEDFSVRSYVAKYFMSVLPHVCDTSYQRDRFVKAISDAARAGDYQVRDGLAHSIWSFPDDWRDAIFESLKDLKESDPDFYNALDSAILPF